MKTKTTTFFHTQLAGATYQIGTQMGGILKQIPGGVDMMFPDVPGVSKEQADKLIELYENCAPGIKEEVQGCADAVGRPVENIQYVWETILTPGCSHLAVMPSKSEQGGTLVARNYDLNESIDDLTLCITRPEGKYAHIGFSVKSFGRTEGMNEHGLCITTSAAGMPVGSLPQMRKPAIQGLQFWIVVRGVLENCKTVDDAVAHISKQTIGSNAHFLVADAAGNSALVTTFDGEKSVSYGDVEEGYLHATNHVFQDDIAHLDPVKIENSLTRYDMIAEHVTKNNKVSTESLKKLFGTEFPAGLSSHAYSEFFGTLRSMVFDLTNRSVEVCFGSAAHNSWHTFDFQTGIPFAAYNVKMEDKSYGPDFWKMVK